MSKNFTLSELTHSDTAIRLGIDNTPTSEAKTNLEYLAMLLEAIRALVCKPVNISSGYRCEALNKAVKGASDSAHKRGLAADISVVGYTPRQLALAIKNSGIKLDQLILEPTWVHVGLSNTKYRNQVLTATRGQDGKMKYTEGIV